ncbi:MAG: SCO1664 family protein [Chloroflexota bacterium]|nr:SCO1664 family protein [Chloroflexota bacterium]
MVAKRLRALQRGESVNLDRHDVAPDSPHARAFVERAEMGDGWLHPAASNFTFVVELALDDQRAYGVYKPERGERPLWDFPPGLYRRECAAYELSLLLGWPIAPPTVVRDGELGVGSLQLFVPPRPDSHFFSLRDDHLEEALRMAVFDLVANNADRKGGHCFVAQTGGVWGIDHGLTLHAEHKLRTVIWDFAGNPVPQPLLDDLARLSSLLDAPAHGAASALTGLLAPDETDALRERVRRLLADPVMPAPTSHRDLPYPWL